MRCRLARETQREEVALTVEVDEPWKERFLSYPHQSEEEVDETTCTSQIRAVGDS